MLCLSQPVDCQLEKDSGALLSAQTITSETISTTTTTQITKVCSVLLVMVRLPPKQASSWLCCSLAGINSNNRFSNEVKHTNQSAERTDLRESPGVETGTCTCTPSSPY